MRRSFDARVGRVALRAMGTCRAAVEQVFQPLQRLAPVAFLGAMVARDDQHFAGVRQAPARELAQPLLCGCIQRARLVQA